MKRIFYQTYEQIDENVYLHYNSFSDKFLLLNKELHTIYVEKSLGEIENQQPRLFDNLKEGQFIVNDDFNELMVLNYRKLKKRFDTSLYQVVINTTLDCNVNCWYCYETKEKGSFLKKEVIEAIKKNIEYKYANSPFLILKMSFFGGEPFLYFEGIKEILSFSEGFCLKNNVQLIADFTTNATLITESQINYLKKFRCYFQIPIDGDKELHNKIKRNKEQKIDAYQLTMNNIHRLLALSPSSYVIVRVNFDKRTLYRFDNILKDIIDVDRQRCSLILKKVWQCPVEDINSDLLKETIQKCLDNKFYVDYYALPKTNLCFAERLNQVLFNYDGKVFKCSTIDAFDDKHAMGKIDMETGTIEWNETKIAQLSADLTQEKCIKCKMYPSCMGPCNKNLIANKEDLCIFDSMNLTEKEFLIYLFKLNLLMNELA